MQTFDDIARAQLAGLEQTLQLPVGAFLPFLESSSVNSSKQSASCLKAFHYMLPEGAAAGPGSLEGCEAHEDKGLLTVVYAATGLQVRESSNLLAVVLTGAKSCECWSTTWKSHMQVQGPDGTWRELPLSQGQIAILAGHTLERATCGLIKAVKHKVVGLSPVSSMHFTAISDVAHDTALCSSLHYTVLRTAHPSRICMLTVMSAGGWCSGWLSNRTKCTGVQAQST